MIKILLSKVLVQIGVHKGWHLCISSLEYCESTAGFALVMYLFGHGICHKSVLKAAHYSHFVPGDILPTSTILASIKQILEDPRPPNPHPLGVLTTQNRDEWAGLREQVESSGNEAALKKVDSGVFLIAFDDDVLEDSSQLTKHFLHGTGTNR